MGRPLPRQRCDSARARRARAVPRRRRLTGTRRRRLQPSILTRASGTSGGDVTTTAVRRSNPMAPALPVLTPAAELALLCRMLHREGYDDHLAGHITYKEPDGTFL